MRPIRIALAVVRGWLLAIVAPRLAAFEHNAARRRVHRQLESTLADWRRETELAARHTAELEIANQRLEARLEQSQDQNAEAVLQRDKLTAENEVLRHQIEKLIQWQETELERLKTEAAIHAMRRRRPPDENEPLQPDG
jgi:septal ring factor EnvC (AmiA/AmiB activator)